MSLILVVFFVSSQCNKVCDLSSLKTIFQSFSDLDDLNKFLSHHAQHSFIVLRLLSSNKYFSDFMFRHRRLNSCNLFSLTKSVPSIVFCKLLFDLLQLVAIRGNFYVMSKTFSEMIFASAFQLVHCINYCDVIHSRASLFRLRLKRRINNASFLPTPTS